MYSVHSEQFNEGGYTMRPILISEDDSALFNANFTPHVVVIYQNHIREIRRMVRQQGIGFWIRFITSFRSHNERHRLMDGIVFPRAEAVFVDMLHLLSCGDNLNELTKLVLSLGAMHAVITANDYHVLMDPVLRVLMTCYDKPLDGLRLYFRFAAGIVTMFRRWRQVSWRECQEGDGWLPWQPPRHWLEETNRDYSEWTFEGRLLHAFGPQLPSLLGLPPGLPSWLPDQLKFGHMLYPPIPLEETPLFQEANSRNIRNKKKGRRRKNRQYYEGFSEYESQPANANHSSRDTGMCLMEQGHEFVSVELSDTQEAVMSRHTADSDKYAEKFDEPLMKKSESTALKDVDSINIYPTSSDCVPSCASENCEQLIETNQNSCIEKSTLMETRPMSSRINSEITCGNEVKQSEQGDGSTAAEGTRESRDFNKKTFTEQNDTSCDQSHHMYRRNVPHCTTFGINNFRSNYQVTELHRLGRPSPWNKNSGNFVHPYHIGYFDAPVVDYLNPASEMRRQGQENRRFRQKRGRQPPILTSIEDNFGNLNETEIQNTGSEVVSQNSTVSETSLDHKHQWQNRRKVGKKEVTINEKLVKSAVNLKVEPTDESFKPSSLLESSVNISQQSGMNALAACGPLGKTSGNQRENSQIEIIKSKFSPCDKQNHKNNKEKSGEQSENESCENYGKLTFSKKKIVKEPEMLKRYTTKLQNNNDDNNVIFDYGNLKTNKGKIKNKVSFPAESQQFDMANKYFENHLSSHLSKHSKLHMEVRRNNIPNEQKEKVFEKRRKWKSVWTRRRETDIQSQKNSVIEDNARKDREERNSYKSDRRKCMPQNVPDILKQVENSELKVFWKENYEAPKPLRKSRPSKRVLKWRQAQETSSRTDNNDNSRNDNITPVVKLDIIPLIEPKDTDYSAQDIGNEKYLHRVTTDQCSSKIGWYEETLAEDKYRENGREISATQSNKNDSMSGSKEHTNKKWKRKQRNYRKEKIEINLIEPFKEESQNQELIDCNDIITNGIQTCDFQDNTVQNKTVIHDNIFVVFNNSECTINDTPRNEFSINDHLMMSVKAKQTTEEQSIKQMTSIKDNSSLDNLYQSSSQNIDLNSIHYQTCHPTIIQELQLNLHLNLGHLESINQLLPKIKLCDREDWNISVDCCQLILEEILNNIPGTIHESQKDTHPEYKKNSQSLEKCQSRTGNIITLVNMDCGRRNKKNEEIAEYKRRQTCVEKTVMYLIRCRFNITVSSIRSIFSSCYMKKRLLKSIGKLLVTDPRDRTPTSLFPVFSSLLTGDPENLLFVPNKLCLRCCDNCKILEKIMGECGECIHCKNTSSPLPHVYCSRICQCTDWKLRRHSQHEHDFENQNRNKQVTM